MKIAFWEKVFKSDRSFLFGSEPNKTITEFEHLFDKNWVVLDVGCGDGKNAFYLAKKGFKNIDAFDSSDSAIEKVNRLKQKYNLPIHAFQMRAEEFEFKKQYDLILSFGVFHFMPQCDWKSFISKAKENTNINGIHIIQIFNDSIAPTPDIAPYAVGMAQPGEIKTLYECDDWEIIQHLSYTFEEEHPGVPLHKHASEKLVARKIK